MTSTIKKPSLSISPSVTVNETDGKVQLQVTLSTPATNTISVMYSTKNGTAKAAVDYTAELKQKLVFKAGETSKTITIPIINDKKVDGNEKFSVSLSSATNALLSTHSTATVTIKDVLSIKPPTGTVTISGTPQVGQILTESNNLHDANGLNNFTYQWADNGVAINGATHEYYILSGTDAGKQITVTANAADNLGKTWSVTSSPVTAGNPSTAPTGNVTISGTPQIGQILTESNTLSDVNGLSNFTYQWADNGNPISGATNSSYTVSTTDAGKQISVIATATDSLGKSWSTTSQSVTVVSPSIPPTGTVTISGTAQVGQVLTESNNLQDVNGLSNFTYQWYDNGTAINGATSQSYTVASGDVGNKITVKVSATDNLGNLQTATSNESGQVTQASPPSAVVSEQLPIVPLITNLTSPADIAIDTTGNIYVIENSTSNCFVQEFTITGETSTLASHLSFPYGIAVDKSGNVYVTENFSPPSSNPSANDTNIVIDELYANKSTGTWAQVALARGVNNVYSLATDIDGTVYFPEPYLADIKKVDSNGVISTVMSGLYPPIEIAVDGEKTVYVSGWASNSSNSSAYIGKIDSNGQSSILLNGLPKTPCIAVDAFGNVYFAEAGKLGGSNGDLKEIATNGQVSMLENGLAYPLGVAVDNKGNIYFVENGTASIKAIAHSNTSINSILSTPLPINNLIENTQQIQLSKTAFTALNGIDTVTTANFSNSASATSTTDYLYYNATNGGVYYASSGSNGSAVEIAIIGSSTHPTALSSGDFKLVA